MEGRESRRAKDIFFVCSLVDYIARKTKNRRSDVVEALGPQRLGRIVELADVYHSDNIDAVSDRFIEEAGIGEGVFDNVAAARYAVPSHWDIGKVYKRLVLAIADREGTTDVGAILRAYRSHGGSHALPSRTSSQLTNSSDSSALSVQKAIWCVGYLNFAKAQNCSRVMTPSMYSET